MSPTRREFLKTSAVIAVTAVPGAEALANIGEHSAPAAEAIAVDMMNLPRGTVVRLQETASTLVPGQKKNDPEYQEGQFVVIRGANCLDHNFRPGGLAVYDVSPLGTSAKDLKLDNWNEERDAVVFSDAIEVVALPQNDLGIAPAP